MRAVRPGCNLDVLIMPVYMQVANARSKRIAAASAPSVTATDDLVPSRNDDCSQDGATDPDTSAAAGTGALIVGCSPLTSPTNMRVTVSLSASASTRFECAWNR